MEPIKIDFAAGSAKSTAGQANCPGCRMPVAGGINFCYHCKHFIDWNQGRVLEPDEVTDDAVEQLMRATQSAQIAYSQTKHSKSAKSGKRLMIIGGILTFTLIFSLPGVLLFLYGLWKYLTSANIPQECLSQKDLGDVIAPLMVPAILNEGFDTVLEYRHSKVFPTRLIHEAQLMQKAYNDVGGSDYIMAVHKGVAVELGDLELKDVQHKGGSFLSGKTVFKGLMMVCSLGLNLPEPVTIWEREGNAPMGDGISTGNPEFDSRFYVESRHPETARTVLTPQLIHYIECLDSVGDGQTSLRFAEDGRLFVMIATEHDLFEIQRLDEPAAAIRARYAEELQRILDLISIVALTRDTEADSFSSTL